MMNSEGTSDYETLINYVKSKSGRCQISRKLLQEMVIEFETKGLGNKYLFDSVENTQKAIDYYETNTD